LYTEQQILKQTGIDLHERRLISKHYMNQGVKVQLHQGEKRNVKMERGVTQGRCLSFYLTYTSTVSTLPRKLLKGLETSKQEHK